MCHRRILYKLLIVVPWLMSCSNDESISPASPAGSTIGLVPEAVAPPEEVSPADLVPEAATPGLFTLLPADSITPFFNGDMQSGDVDGDGDNDLLTTGSTATGALTRLYLNDGSGAFTESTTTSFPGVENSAVVLKDFDQDADKDILILGAQGEVSEAYLYFNNGTGVFDSSDAHSIEPLALPTIVTGDVDNNSTEDLLVAGYSDDEYKVELYLNNGFGQFFVSPVASFDVSGQRNHSAQLGDIDNDSDLDIVVMFLSDSARHKIVTFENNGAGEYILKTTSNVTDEILSEGYSHVQLGDFDSDGDADLMLVLDANSFRHWAGSSGFKANDGDGNFGRLQRVSMPTRNGSFCTSDIDGDNTTDIVVVGESHSSDTIYIGGYQPDTNVLLNQGSMMFQRANAGEILEVFSGTCELSDINGDGKVDLLVTGLEPDNVDAQPVFRAYLNTSE